MKQWTSIPVNGKVTKRVNPNDRSDELINRYLLGRLDEDNRRLIEERYFDDDQFFARLLEVETRLIQQYADGGLSPEERERFESHFLTSASRREKVESAMAAARRRQSQDKVP